MQAGLLGGRGDGGWAWEVAGAGAVATSFWQRWHGAFAWTQGSTELARGHCQGSVRGAAHLQRLLSAGQDRT